MSHTIDAGVCERLITAATSHCASAPVSAAASTQAASQPNFDAMALSLSALSNAFVYGSILIGIFVVALGIAWAVVVRAQAKEEAVKAAKEIMDDWLDKVAPCIIRDGKQLLNQNGNSLDQATAQEAADNIGNQAG